MVCDCDEYPRKQSTATGCANTRGATPRISTRTTGGIRRSGAQAQDAQEIHDNAGTLDSIYDSHSGCDSDSTHDRSIHDAKSQQSEDVDDDVAATTEHDQDARKFDAVEDVMLIMTNATKQSVGSQTLDITRLRMRGVCVCVCDACCLARRQGHVVVQPDRRPTRPEESAEGQTWKSSTFGRWASRIRCQSVRPGVKATTFWAPEGRTSRKRTAPTDLAWWRWKA